MDPFTHFKLLCHRDLERAITNVSYIKSPLGVFAQYTINDEQRNFFMDKESFSELLLEEEIIHKVIYQGERMVMQKKVLFTVTGSAGQPVQYERYVEYRWEDVCLDTMFIQTVAVLHEFERVNKLAKVVEFTKEYFKKTG